MRFRAFRLLREWKVNSRHPVNEIREIFARCGSIPLQWRRFTIISCSFLLLLQCWTWRRAKHQCRSRPMVLASRRKPSTDPPRRSSQPKRVRWRSPSAFHGGTLTFSNRTWCSWSAWISGNRAAVSEIECDFRCLPIQRVLNVAFFGNKRMLLRTWDSAFLLGSGRTFFDEEAQRKNMKKWENFLRSILLSPFYLLRVHMQIKLPRATVDLASH